MANFLLGIDIGTSACKVAVFDTKGEVLAQSNQPYKVYYPNPGWAEQDANEWWEAIVAGIRHCLSQNSISAEDIAGIGVDGQSWSAIPVDRDGRVLDRTPIWMDTRARDICEEVKDRVGEDEIFKVAGNDFLPSYSTPKLLWFKREKPDVYKNTYKFLQSNSYIVYKLTGIMSQDLSQGYGLHFFDMEKLEYDGALAERLGLSVDQVPGLFGCDEVVGTVTEEAERLTGLKKGTPVVAGGLDAASG